MPPVCVDPIVPPLWPIPPVLDEPPVAVLPLSPLLHAGAVTTAAKNKQRIETLERILVEVTPFDQPYRDRCKPG